MLRRTWRVNGVVDRCTCLSFSALSGAVHNVTSSEKRKFVLTALTAQCHISTLELPRRENVDAQAVSTDGRVTLYANTIHLSHHREVNVLINLIVISQLIKLLHLCLEGLMHIFLR
jgi:hypothetical protein